MCNESPKGSLAHIYGKTVNAVRYLNFLGPFLVKLTEEGKVQDSVTPHMAHVGF
jgi:hypothetical protein